ncbi:A24 family peptidase [Paenibacillus sp. MMS18-CY102]|uniref:A24 family peptidase n=1 Tax=Paenibacillus sp. MMS18-CY102 TaxID=2682849 RepID=UPI001365C79E|nr:A24 family peptidase [Paenibacillus sp. MMS18-CY102]MWC30101.1 prepilin peptidase [Paenibacillus sp. MMS18-CY102]
MLLGLEHIGACILVMIALVTDVRSMRIPNWLTGLSFGGALLCHVAANGQDGLKFALAGALVGFTPLLAMYAIKGVGAGDVKLFAALGAWLGTMGVIQLFVYSIWYAGAIGILLLAMRKLIRLKPASQERIANKSKVLLSRLIAGGTRFPFMLAVAPAAATCWLLF